MLDRDDWVEKGSAILSPLVARSVKEIYFNIVDLEFKTGFLGNIIDIKPFKGKVVGYTDEAMLVKKNRDHFSIVDLAYVTAKPEVGKRVMVIPYSQRHFDGRRVDGYIVEKKGASEVTHLKIGEYTKLPVPVADIKCPQLLEMINQIENMPAPTGVRKVIHILVDAKATNFTFNDPKPNEIIDSPPFLMCHVDTEKFRGNVKIIYDRGLDAYNITLLENGEIVKAAAYVLFDEVGSILEQFIDDRSWQKIEIQEIGK